jgi:hypothetical protein
MSAMIKVIWPRKSAGGELATRTALAGAGKGSSGHTRIQAASPWRAAKAKPQPDPLCAPLIA